MKNYQLVNNPKLESIYPEYPGNTMFKKRYIGDESRYLPSWGTLAKWLFSFNPQFREKRYDTFQVPFHENENFLQTAKDQIVWLGHASFFIQLNGKRIITDPCWFNIFTKSRKVAIPCKAASFVNIDYILISHAHRDHLDFKTLKIIIKNNPKVQIMTGLGMTKLFPKAWRENIQEAGWYQKYNWPQGIDISYLPAQHWNRRGIWDLDLQLWGSFFITDGNKKIYFGGDTASGKHFDEARRILGNMDISILPVGAYKPAYMMRGVHLNPNESIMAAKFLGAKTLIPMHYGTYSLSDEPIGEPIRLIQKAQEAGHFNFDFRPLGIGEVLEL